MVQLVVLVITQDGNSDFDLTNDNWKQLFHLAFLSILFNSSYNNNKKKNNS